ncbi:MAG: (Fe-S)-binding protein [Rhodanobacteraceae bacterium]|nr:(Fe-S)-binding protein [Rhodanobacteraceae bacterium]
MPACPTYRVAQTEAESPRGRITMAKALATGTLLPESGAAAHIDHCLHCLSCERACPSGVQYGRLIGLQRRLTAMAPGRLQRFAYALVARPRWLHRMARLSNGLRLARWLSPLARRCGRDRTGIGRWIALIPPLPTLSGLDNVASAPRGRGRIGLFLGCVASAFDRDTHAAARILLAALGYEVVEPPAQGCCGALAQHAGHVEIAATLAAATGSAFATSGVGTVLVSASGCYASLRDRVFRGSAIAVREISEFLAADPLFTALPFAALPLRAALHNPCSLNNEVRAASAARELLQHIPQLHIADTPTQPRCCGAGGTHFLRYPELADPLRDERLDQVEALGAELLLTSNIGCRLHLAGGLRTRGRTIEVLHPITLLARQLKKRRDSPTPSLPSHQATS